MSISKKSIRVGQGFSISCIAQGSIYMTFTWLKDGAFINESVITRSVSMHLIYLSRGRYQYTLVMDKANLLDEGIYTCHVSDWHVQQCKGIHVNVAGPPEIRLSPMSATVEKVKKNNNFSLGRCEWCVIGVGGEGGREGKRE